MFTKKITESDAFLDMPSSSQMLYLHLCMNADDDGFVNNTRKIQRMCGASDDDLKILIAKSFVITFQSGIIVIKHWKMHNYIQKDRYKPTDYMEEKSMLGLKRNGAYTLDESKMVSRCIDDINQKLSGFKKPTIKEVRKFCAERNSSVEADSFYRYFDAKNWMHGKERLVDWKEEIISWENARKKGSDKDGRFGRNNEQTSEENQNWLEQFNTGEQ